MEINVDRLVSPKLTGAAPEDPGVSIICLTMSGNRTYSYLAQLDPGRETAKICGRSRSASSCWTMRSGSHEAFPQRKEHLRDFQHGADRRERKNAKPVQRKLARTENHGLRV